MRNLTIEFGINFIKIKCYWIAYCHQSIFQMKLSFDKCKKRFDKRKEHQFLVSLVSHRKTFLKRRWPHAGRGLDAPVLELMSIDRIVKRFSIKFLKDELAINESGFTNDCNPSAWFDCKVGCNCKHQISWFSSGVQLVFAKWDWEKISGIRDPVYFQDAGSGILSGILRDYSKTHLWLAK